MIRSRMPDTHARRLSILDFGLFQVHENGRIIGIPGYFVEGGGGEHILIDAGWPPWYEDDAERAAADDGLNDFGRILELSDQQTPTAQLEKLGLRARDVTQLVITHGDIDHIGRMDLFEHATHYIGRAEREMERPRYFGGRARMEWPSFDDVTYELVDDDTEIAPGVTLLSTPGHSPGHLSVMVRLRETGPVVLAGDAINREDELVDWKISGSTDDAAARRSAERLVKLRDDEKGWLIYGHDPAQWPTLRKSPACYV